MTAELTAAKDRGCERPVFPRPGSGSGLRLPGRSLGRLTALQVKGDTNNLKMNCVLESV